MSTSSTSLRPLRLKLTLWYLATLCAIIALLGGGLFIAIGHRFAVELDQSLKDATAQLELAAGRREMEAGLGGKVVDAVEELHISDRSLYLLDSLAAPVTPADTPDWIRDAARQLGRVAIVDLEHEVRRDKTLKLHEERFQLSSGRVLIAVAVADRIELEDRYAALEKQHEGKPVPRPPHWSGFRVAPASVEFWKNRAGRLHDREIYTRASPDAPWSMTLLNP